MTAAIDVEAERRRALERRRERDAQVLLDGRARRVLELQWNATREEMRERIGFLWPRMGMEEVEALLAETLKVQTSERRPRAVDTRTLRPPPPEEPKKEFPGVVSVFEMEPHFSPKKAIMAKKRKNQESAADKSTRILSCLHEHLAAGENLTDSAVRNILGDELEITVSMSLANYYKRRALETFAKIGPTPSSEPAETPAPPADAAPTPESVVEEEPEATPLPEKEAATFKMRHSEPGQSPKVAFTAGHATAATTAATALVTARTRRSVLFSDAHLHVLRFAGVDEEVINRVLGLAEFINTIPEADHA